MRKNAIFMAIYEVAIYLSPFITAPYIARVLGAYGTGVYSYSYSIASYFVVLTQLGVKLYGRREIAACLTKEERSITFWGIWMMETLMFVLSTILYLGFVILNKTEIKLAFALQYFMIAGAWLDISWLFFGVEDYKIAVFRNILVKVLSLILVFTLIHKKEDYNLYVLIMSMSSFLSVAVMWATIKKHISFIPLNVQMIRTHWRPMLKMLIPTISTQLCAMTDKVFLGALASTEAVGIYDNANRIARMPVAVISSIGIVLLPRMTQMIAQGREAEANSYFEKAFSITFIFGVSCAFGLISVARTFIPLYLGEGFMESIVVLQLLALLLVAIGWGCTLRNQFILPKKMDSLYIRSELYGAILNVALNAALIPFYASTGAAIATLIAEFAICFYQSWKIRQYFDFKKIICKNLKYVVAAIFMSLVIYLGTENLNCGLLVKVIVQIVLGGTVFIGTCCLLEWVSNEWVILDEGTKIASGILQKKKHG